MGSLDQIAQQRRAGKTGAPAAGGTLDQIAAQRGSAGTPAIPTVTAPAPVKKSGGGLLGVIEHGAHWVADKAGLAAHDVKTIPGGLYDIVNTEQHLLRKTIAHPLANPNDPRYGVNAGKWGQHANQLVHGMEQGAVTSIEHPLRDPFQTALTVLPLVTGGASAAARVGAVTRAAGEGASVGDLARAAVHTPQMPPRLINVGDTEVPLQHSANPAVRAVQAVHDKVVQHAIDTNPESRIAAYGTKRVGGSLAETARYQQRLRDVPAQLLDRAAKHLAPADGKIPGATINKFQRVEQAALELTSVNTTPEAAAAYHLAQAEKGVEPALNRAVSKLYTVVAKRGLLATNEHGDVIVNATDHPALAHADAQLAQVQGRGDEILARYGVRTPEELQAAVNAPGRYRAGATYEKPTAAKAGVPSQTLLKARARVTRLEALHERATAKASEKAVPYGNVHTRTGRPVANSLAEIQAKHPNVELSASENDHGITLSMIRTAEGERGKGLARKALADLTAYADKKQKPLALTPEPVGGGLTKAQLAKWYRGQGFKRNAGANKDFQFRETLVRPPATPKAPKHVEVAPGPRTPGVPSDLPPRGVNTPTVERLGGALSVARDELARLEAQAAGRVKPTGIVGGETARPGRGHVSYAGSEPKAPKSPAASAASSVVGVAKAPVTSHANEGINIGRGVVPKDVTGQAARHFRQIVRFVNTTEHRNQAIQAGTGLRRSSRDVLVKIPGEQHAKIPAAVGEILGKTKLTADDVAGIHAALDAYKQELVPGLADNFAEDRNTAIGTSAKDAAEARGLDAPAGHVWVDRNILGDLGKTAAGPRGRFARSVDTVNAAVTAATVYFKIGHIGTRVLTNASTNIIQGSARPLEIAKSVKLWHALSDSDKLRALAVAGQHSFRAMPHEGTNWVSRVAGGGANFWARHADAPFRFNSIAYEARKAGFDTPAKFKGMLDRLESPADFKMNAAEHAKIDWVAKRANREGIAYDRMSEGERRYLTRAIWFYPWLKGTVGFAGNTMFEHPLKASALANVGVQGRATQEKELGALPTYEQGLLKLGGSTDRPLVADFSTFSPFATPADIVTAVAHPGQLSGFLNPAFTAGENLITGKNQYGQTSKSPLKDALASLVSPTPEAQILTGFLQRHQNQSRRMFPKSTAWGGTKDPLLRALIGPGMPRRMNVNAAHSTAARERAGR